mgnify:CR=1 FL=1
MHRFSVPVLAASAGVRSTATPMKTSTSRRRSSVGAMRSRRMRPKATAFLPAAFAYQKDVGQSVAAEESANHA